MELVLVAVGALLLGFLAHAALPGRDTRGLLLVPGLTVAVAGVAWVALTWAGLRPDTAWPWLVAAVLVLATALVVPLATVGRRRRADVDLFARLVRS